MATANTVVAWVDRVKPNAYTDEEKFHWINTLEGSLSLRVLGQTEPTVYDFPQDADRELLAPRPFDDLYGLYVSAMIDYHNREYSSYNNTVLLLRERLEQFQAWYIRTHGSGPAAPLRHVTG